MKFWRSVVVKLWFTILLLVSVRVIYSVSVTIMEFLQNYSASENEKDLTTRAEKIAKIVETHNYPKWVWKFHGKLIDDVTSVTIVKDPTNIILRQNQGKTLKLPVSYFLENEEFVQGIGTR